MDCQSNSSKFVRFNVDLKMSFSTIENMNLISTHVCDDDTISNNKQLKAHQPKQAQNSIAAVLKKQRCFIEAKKKTIIKAKR